MSKAILSPEDFGSKIYNRFPNIYKVKDKEEAKDALRRYINALADGGMRYIIEDINKLLTFYDVEKADMKIMPYVFKSFGFEIFNGIPENYVRNLLPVIGELYRKKGNVEVVEYLTTVISNVQSTVEVITNDRFDAHFGKATFGKAIFGNSGDTQGVIVTLEMDYGASDKDLPEESQIRRIISEFLPFYCFVIVIYLFEYFEDERLRPIDADFWDKITENEVDTVGYDESIMDFPVLSYIESALLEYEGQEELSNFLTEVLSDLIALDGIEYDTNSVELQEYEEDGIDAVGFKTESIKSAYTDTDILNPVEFKTESVSTSNESVGDLIGTEYDKNSVSSLYDTVEKLDMEEVETKDVTDRFEEEDNLYPTDKLLDYFGDNFISIASVELEDDYHKNGVISIYDSIENLDMEEVETKDAKASYEDLGTISTVVQNITSALFGTAIFGQAIFGDYSGSTTDPDVPMDYISYPGFDSTRIDAEEYDEHTITFLYNTVQSLNMDEAETKEAKVSYVEGDIVNPISKLLDFTGQEYEDGSEVSVTDTNSIDVVHSDYERFEYIYTDEGEMITDVNASYSDDSEDMYDVDMLIDGVVRNEGEEADDVNTATSYTDALETSDLTSNTLIESEAESSSAVVDDTETEELSPEEDIFSVLILTGDSIERDEIDSAESETFSIAQELTDDGTFEFTESINNGIIANDGQDSATLVFENTISRGSAVFGASDYFGNLVFGNSTPNIEVDNYNDEVIE